MSEPNGNLTYKDLDEVLRGELLPVHFNDPNIVKFITQYLKCNHPGQAALESGLTRGSGKVLLDRKDIFEAVRKCRLLSATKFGLDPSRIVARVDEVADANIFDVMDDNMQLLDKKAIPEALQRAVKKFEVEGEAMKDINGMPMYGPNGQQLFEFKFAKIEMHDKIKAGELLAREVDVFKEKKIVQHEMTDNMANILLGAAQRAEERRALMEARKAEQQAPVVEIEFKEVKDASS